MAGGLMRVAFGRMETKKDSGSYSIRGRNFVPDGASVEECYWPGEGDQRGILRSLGGEGEPPSGITFCRGDAAPRTTRGGLGYKLVLPVHPKREKRQLDWSADHTN